jgi:amino acid adenylation domain-containing protein
LAIKSKQRELTYRELNQGANRIARSIIAQEGAGQQAAALLLGDAAAMSSAILGALKAGKIYVPLDPTMPLPGLVSILENSQASTILIDDSMLPLGRQLSREGIRLINIDEVNSNVGTENLGLSISPDRLAYILYTSGSTGKPKAVFQNHGNVLKKTLVYTNTAHVSADDKLSLVAPFGFAAVMQSFFGSLLNGAALYPWKIQDNPNLAGWLRAEEITIYRSAASVFRHLIDTLSENEKLPQLRLIDLFGEPISAADVEHYKKHLSADFILRNHFASTETGIVSEYYVDRSTRLTTGVVPVGYPVEGAEIRLLDEDGRRVAVNTTGEIAVKTRDLVLGYWRDPDLTRTKFIPDSEAGGEPVFLTGDLGRMLPDGCLMHMGRKDSRVKIRGHTVEPAAVEMALLEHVAIKEAVVVAQEDLRNEKRLIAYVVSGSGTVVKPEDLRAFLESRLQAYMVPSVFVPLDALPLNSNGKVDRQALPAPERPKPESGASFVSPQNATEKALAKIWREVLQLDEVGIHDSFLELGGHSLDAVRVMSRIFNLLGVQLSVDVFFANPTVAGIAETIQKIQSDSWDVEEAAEAFAARRDKFSEEQREARPTSDKNKS